MAVIVEAAESAPFEAPRPISAVLFDVHSTLLDQGSADEWLDAALTRSPHDLDAVHRERLVAFLDRVWEGARVRDPFSTRDLTAADHYRVFHELLEHAPSVDRELGDALYEGILDTWHAYADTVPVLAELRSMGVAVGLLSNVGVSTHELLEREGLLDLADAVTLSYEVGVVKPDPAIFQHCLDALGVSALDALMVGDSGHDDAGGTALGMRTLILPRTRGSVHGLAVIPGLVRASREALG